jgi:hypothetical protein
VKELNSLCLDIVPIDALKTKAAEEEEIKIKEDKENKEDEEIKGEANG